MLVRAVTFPVKTCMSAKFFLDTNIVVYTFDAESPQKNRCAQELVEQALRTQEGVVSTQVVQEFLNVATTKFTVPLTLSDAQQYIQVLQDFYPCRYRPELPVCQDF